MAPWVCAIALLAASLAIQEADGLYHTGSETLHWFAAAAKHHPDLLRVDDEGKAYGIQEPVATITKFAAGGREEATPGSKKRVLLVASEHARELITTEVVLALSRLLVGDGGDMLEWPQMQQALRDHLGLSGGGGSAGDLKAAFSQYVGRLLDSTIVKVVPLVNLAGRQEVETGHVCLRKTPLHVDLNRNWPFAWKRGSRPNDVDYGGTAPFSEPQTKVLRDVAVSFRPHAFVNIHSGEWAAYTPWDSRRGYGPGQPADMQDLVNKYEKICDCIVGPAGAISGYLAYGTSMDYFYTELKVPYCITLEVYGSRGPGRLMPGKLQPPQRNAPLASYGEGAAVISAAVGHRRRRLASGGNELRPELVEPLEGGAAVAWDEAAQEEEAQRGGAATARKLQWGIGGGSSSSSSSSILFGGAGSGGAGGGTAGGDKADAVLAMVGRTAPSLQRCFQDFNPHTEPLYRDAVAKWVVALLATCQHVAKF